MQCVQDIPSTAYIVYSIPQVQHTPSIGYTDDWISPLQSPDYELTPEYTLILWCAYLHNRTPSASSPWELKYNVTFSPCKVCQLSNWGIQFQHLAHWPSTASKYSPNLAWLQPPSPHNHGLQVHHHTPSITVSNCVSELAWSRPASQYHHGLPLGHETCLIKISKCISTLTWSRAPSVSPKSCWLPPQMPLETRSIVESKLARLWPWSVSHNTLGYRFHVDLQTCSIMSPQYITEFTPSSFSEAPRIALKHRLQLVLLYCV